MHDFNTTVHGLVHTEGFVSDRSEKMKHLQNLDLKQGLNFECPESLGMKDSSLAETLVWDILALLSVHWTWMCHWCFLL